MYTKEFEEGFLIPFIEQLTNVETSGRAVAFLAGPPAAGKSTLAARIEELSLTVPGLQHVQALPMDGFHKKQAYLKSHYFLRDGVQTPLTEIKGAPETFDPDALLESIKKSPRRRHIALSLLRAAAARYGRRRHRGDRSRGGHRRQLPAAGPPRVAGT